jgi:outer membrane protein
LEKIFNISLADREAYKEEQNLRTVEMQLASDTAQAFYDLASAQADLANIQESLDLMQDRVKELKTWLNIGKSRPSEVYAAESSAALIAAQLEDAKAAVDSAADKLALVMGVDSVMIQQPVETDAQAPTIDAAAAAGARSDVKAAMAELEAQGRRIQMGVGAFLPQVDLNLTKYIGGTPYMAGTAYKDNGWQMMLTANWTFFEGGSRVFDSISALSEEEALRQQMRSTLANVKYEIKSKLRDFIASGRKVTTMKDAFVKTEQSLKAQQKDYNYGLVTNVDVLQAMSERATVKQSLDETIIKKEMNKVLLDAALEEYK